jgi:hypothetical protein
VHTVPKYGILKIHLSMVYPEDGASTLLRNVGSFVVYFMALSIAELFTAEWWEE